MASELERIELIVSKLSHPIWSVRTRAADNLLSKIEKGVFNRDVLSLPSCSTMIIKGVHESFAQLNLAGSNENLSNGQGRNLAMILARTIG